MATDETWNLKWNEKIYKKYYSNLSYLMHWHSFCLLMCFDPINTVYVIGYSSLLGTVLYVALFLTLAELINRSHFSSFLQLSSWSSPYYSVQKSVILSLLCSLLLATHFLTCLLDVVVSWIFCFWFPLYSTLKYSPE